MFSLSRASRTFTYRAPAKKHSFTRPFFGETILPNNRALPSGYVRSRHRHWLVLAAALGFSGRPNVDSSVCLYDEVPVLLDTRLPSHPSLSPILRALTASVDSLV